MGDVGWGCRVDVNRKVKFFENSIFFSFYGGGSDQAVGWGRMVARFGVGG